MEDITITSINQNDFVQIGCRIIIDKAKDCIYKRGRFSFVLSGGKTPALFLEKLYTDYKDTIDWGKVDFFWVDERCVAPNDDNSNYKLAYQLLISKLSNKGCIYRILGELSPKEAAVKYENLIKKYFIDNQITNFDFVLLGMGEDGHVASIFPGEELISNNVFSTIKKFGGFFRVSMNLELINSIEFKLLLVNTDKKKLLLKQGENYPINLINRKSNLVLTSNQR